MYQIEAVKALEAIDKGLSDGSLWLQDESMALVATILRRLAIDFHQSGKSIQTEPEATSRFLAAAVEIESLCNEAREEMREDLRAYEANERRREALARLYGGASVFL
jgi:hypothetical protein